jgi:hypothetical protein
MLGWRKCWASIGLVVLGCVGSAFSQTVDRRELTVPTSPEQREKFYGRMLDRYMERLTAAYRLDETQRGQVHQQLEQLKAEHDAYAAPLRKEFEAATREWAKMRKQREAGKEIDQQRYDQIRGRMREMWQGSPFMNPARVVSSVEQILPPEQVKKGRKHRDEILGEWRRGREEAGSSRRQRGADGSQTPAEAAPVEAVSVDRWKQYVDEFSRKYQLDASQRSTADSLLRSAIEQRDAYEKSHESDFAAAKVVQDPSERLQRTRSLNEPVREYFDQLKSGLDKIPTTAQRTAVEPPPVPQSQPSTAPHGRGKTSRGSSHRK